MTFSYLLIFHHLPSKPQSEWHRDDERMFRVIGFKTTAISKVIEHIGFQIQTERLE